MAFRAIGFGLLISSLLVGCGTAANLVRPGPEDGKTPFGGVKQDMACIQKAANGDLPAHQDKDTAQIAQVALMLCCAADSFRSAWIGDVVVWPYTCAYTFINEPVPVPPVRHRTPVQHRVASSSCAAATSTTHGSSTTHDSSR